MAQNHNASGETIASRTCITLQPGELIISRTNFIITITLCVLLILVSLIGIALFIYREHARRRANQQAKAFGRQSRYLRRISHARKEVDDSFSQQYSGCLVQQFENPEMGSESPVELMHEQRCWEAPGMHPLPEKVKRKSGASSLIYQDPLTVWIP